MAKKKAKDAPVVVDDAPEVVESPVESTPAVDAPIAVENTPVEPEAAVEELVPVEDSKPVREKSNREKNRATNKPARLL